MLATVYLAGPLTTDSGTLPYTHYDALELRLWVLRVLFYAAALPSIQVN